MRLVSSSLSSFERDSVNDLLHKLLQIEIEHATCRYFGRKEGSVRERQDLSTGFCREPSGILCVRPLSSLTDEDNGELGLGLEPFARQSVSLTEEAQAQDEALNERRGQP